MTASELPDDQRSTVETFVSDWLAEQRIPGAALAVVEGDGIAYSEGFGARRLEGNAPATPDTLFGVGSCTKAVTATAVLQLVEAGELALSDPVEEYVPHLSDAPGDPVTVEELLTHTSGMPVDAMARVLTGRALAGEQVAVPLSSEADFRRHVQGSLDRRVSDRDFRYYNSGYTVLGRVVEAVTGQSFADHVREAVLDPLEMDRATFHREAFEAEADRMTPYVGGEDSPTPTGLPFDPLVHPAGGLVSSVRELAALVRLFSGGGSVGDETLLSPESVEAMTTPVGTFGTYLDGREVGYGYGLMVEEYLGDRLVGHGGSVGSSSAWFGYLEDAGLGVALACTTTPEPHPADAGMAVLALLRGEDPASVQPHYRLRTALDAATGEYENYRAIDRVAVEQVGGGLRVEMGAGEEGGREQLLTPVRVEEDQLVCTTVQPSGMEREARFEFGGEEVDLFLDYARFEKSG